ncbi:MAG: hypothetical protein JST65_22970 [Acidobacteria bacterium]|nr:hypothetical protein [Acidobacteriota bacterium]
MELSISLDREVYLPREIPEITIRIKNPTIDALMIPLPLNRSTTGLLHQYKWPTGRFAPSNEHWVRPEFATDTPTTKIQAGEAMEFSFLSDKDSLNDVIVRSAPDEPNEYRWSLVYLGASPAPSANYRVMHGTSLERVINVSASTAGAERRKVVVIKTALEDFAIGVSRELSLPADETHTISRPYTGNGSFTPFRRIATSKHAIKELEAHLNASDQIVVRWVDVADLQKEVVLNQELKILSEK